MSIDKLVKELAKEREKLAEYLTPLLGLLEPIEGEISIFQRIILHESVEAMRAGLENLTKTIDRLQHEGNLARRNGTDELLEQD